jgi:hypothetical protein
VRDRILLMSNYVVSGYMSDPAAARGQAIMAFGQTIEQQPLFAANGDVLAALGVTLIAVAWLALLATKYLRRPVLAPRGIGWRMISDNRVAALAFAHPTTAVTHPAAVALYDEAVTRLHRLSVPPHRLRQNRG